MGPEPNGKNASSARPIFWVLLGVVLLGSFVLVGVLFVRNVEKWLNARASAASGRTSAAASGRVERRRTAAHVALAPLPVKSPLVERPGADAFGYPRSYVDQGALRSLLGRGKYKELSQYAEEYEKQFEADYRTEYYVRAVSDAFGSAEPELGPMLDAWVQATPTSFAPFLARGSHHVDAGFAERGTAWAKDTDPTNFVAMNREFAIARADLERAAALAPNSIAPLRELMRIAYASSSRAEFDRLARRAFALCPLCMQPRVVEQYALEPRWGGSYPRMAAAAAAAPVARNPKLALLPGYAEIDRASDLVRDEELDAALDHVERACKLGDHTDFLGEKADILKRKKDLPGALAVLRRALDLTPSNAGVLFELARVEADAKDYRAAFVHLRAGLRLSPASSAARSLVPFVVQGLTFVGWEAHKRGLADEALAALDEAAELDPNRDVESRRNAVLTAGFHGTDAELAALDKAARAAPRDFSPHVRLDYALSTRRDWPRIVDMWTQYLKDNPDDARAYRERAGTYVHLGQPQAARADAERACELGSSAACALARSGFVR